MLSQCVPKQSLDTQLMLRHASKSPAAAPAVNMGLFLTYPAESLEQPFRFRIYLFKWCSTTTIIYVNGEPRKTRTVYTLTEVKFWVSKVFISMSLDVPRLQVNRNKLGSRKQKKKMNKENIYIYKQDSCYQHVARAMKQKWSVRTVRM